MGKQDLGRPQAIFFGSINTLTETYDLHRIAFNAAFEAAGVPWHWSPSLYRSLLPLPDDTARIRHIASTVGPEVDADSVVSQKNVFFHNMLSAVDLPLRPGVAEVITRAAEMSLPLVLITDAPQSELVGVLRAVFPPIGRADFRVVITGDEVSRATPDDGYRRALKHLNAAPGSCLAIAESDQDAFIARAQDMPAVVFPSAFRAPRALPLDLNDEVFFGPARFGHYGDAPVSLHSDI